MLRASHRLLRSGGRTAFYAIYIVPGLSPTEYQRAARAGPSSVRSRRTPRTLLAAAGSDAVRETDLTDAFGKTSRAWYETAIRLEPHLRAAMGDEAFERSQADRSLMNRAIDDGLLRRGLLVGERRS